VNEFPNGTTDMGHTIALRSLSVMGRGRGTGRERSISFAATESSLPEFSLLARSVSTISAKQPGGILPLASHKAHDENSSGDELDGGGGRDDDHRVKTMNAI